MTSTIDDSLLAPFAGLSAVEGRPLEPPVQEHAAGVASPFASLLGEAHDPEADEVAALLEAMHDEDFEDALQRLTDEAAARHLADLSGWSGRLSDAEAWASLEHWVEPLAEAAERAVGDFGVAIEASPVAGLGGGELEQLLEGLAPDPPPLGNEVFEQFVGRLLKKARTFAGKALRKVGQVVSKVIPIGPLLKKLAGLVRPLLRKVLRTAIGKLPASVQPLARAAAKKLGLGEAEVDLEGAAAFAEAFDLEAAALLYAPDVAEHEAWSGEDEEPQRDVVSELEAGRERLAQELSGLAPDESPGPAIEQFVPLVLAVRPLLKLAVSAIGRDRLVRFFGDKLGLLLKPLVGTQASALLGRPLADVGLRVIGFEHAGEREALVGEALASTVEGTVLRTLELLPEGGQEDELLLEAALGEAFAATAAAYLPDSLLRQDLAERETAGEGGVWVLMPRASRPRYRFRKYSRVFAVPVTRQVARAVSYGEGGTLETHLLERGVDSWPVQTEVDLYEAVPGTELGHLTQDEGLAVGERPASDEFQPLTPDVAGMLLGEPALGRRLPTAAPGARLRPIPGRRWFRVRPQGVARAAGARRRRVLVGLDLSTGRLRVVVRLTEREAQRVLLRLRPTSPRAPRDVAGVLAALRGWYEPVLSGRVATRLQRRGLLTDPASARAAVRRITSAVDAALSGFLSTQSPVLAAAAQDAADGVVVTVTFSGVTRSSLLQSLPAGQVAVAPGWGIHG